jgi:hypothetical protein
VVVVAALVATACTTNAPSDAHYYHNFQTAVAQAPTQHYTGYWLGRSFVQGGVTFKGPSVPDFGQVGDGTLTMSYDTGATGGYGFSISLFSRSAWAAELENGYGGAAPGATRLAVTIAGASATVTTGPVHNEGVRIDIDFRDTHVMAVAGPTFDKDNVDVNTLNNKDAFIAVLQHLRPYPQ